MIAFFNERMSFALASERLNYGNDNFRNKYYFLTMTANFISLRM